MRSPSNLVSIMKFFFAMILNAAAQDLNQEEGR
jgi:hypothetical protein